MLMKFLGRMVLMGSLFFGFQEIVMGFRILNTVTFIQDNNPMNSLLEASKKFQHDLGNHVFKIQLKMEHQQILRSRRKYLVKILARWIKNKDLSMAAGRYLEGPMTAKTRCAYGQPGEYRPMLTNVRVRIPIPARES